MSQTVTGIVNGVPVTAVIATAGSNPITIPFFPAGSGSTLAVDTDGGGLHSPNHRVAIVCGTVSGKDHFPFIIQSVPAEEVGMGTIFPLAFSIEEVCLMFYRVKRFSIAVDLEYTDPDDPDNPDYPIIIANTFFADAGGILGSVSGYTSESDLVFPRYTIAGDNTTTSNFQICSTPYEYSNGVVEGNTSTPAIRQRVVEHAGLLYPSFVIESDVSDGPGTANPDFTDSGAFLKLPFISPSDLAIPSGRPGYSGHITVDAVEYWPYATKAGLAVYNTSTGAQLRDPLS